MDQDKPYFEGHPPKPSEAPSATQIDAVGLRKAVSESLRPVLTAIPAQIADGVAKAMAGMPKEPTYTADPDKIAAAVAGEISKLKPPEFNFEMPEAFKLDQATIEAITEKKEMTEAIDRLGEKFKLMTKEDAGVSMRTLVEEMMKNPKLWLNVRFTDGQKFLDKIGETIMVGMGGSNVAKDTTLLAILSRLSQTLTTSGTQTIAAQTTELLDENTTLLTANETYTGPWTRVMGKYGALNVASFINVSGFGGANRYAAVQVQFSSDGVTWNGTFVTLAVGYSDANPANVSINILDNYARLVITASGSDNYDWSAAGGTLRTTLVGVPSGSGSFVRPVGSSTVIGDVDPVAPGVMVAGRETANPANAPLPWGMTATTGGEGIGQVEGVRTAITGNALVTAERGGTTGTLSNVNEATSSTTLAASSTSRRGFIVFNDTSNPLKLKFGSAASATSFTVIVAAGTQWQMPLALYTGIITGISVGTGGVWRVTTW